MSSSHRHSFSPPPPQPSIYPFRDRDQKNRFLRLVRQHLGRHGDPVTIGDGFARVAGDPRIHGLLNLAQECNHWPEAEWPRLIHEHFAKSEPHHVQATLGSIVEGGFALNAAKLVVRIYRGDHLSAKLAEHFVQRVDLEAMSTVLAVDIGPSLVALPRPVAETWGVPDHELFDRALANLAANNKATWTPLPLGPQHRLGIDMLLGDFHAATTILQREPHLPRVGRAGNLLGIPVCDMMFSYPLDAALDGLTLQSLLAIAVGRFSDGPNAVTPNLYWRTPEGELQLQRAMRHGDGHRFVPSPDFVECMVRLQRGGAPPSTPS